MHRHRPGGNGDDVIYGQAGNDRIVDTTAQLWPAAVEATTDLTTNARCPTGRPHPKPRIGQIAVVSP
jgi:Ca2+-binding RTX toxin-like protein